MRAVDDNIWRWCLTASEVKPQAVLQMWAINSGIESWNAVTNFEVTYSSIHPSLSVCLCLIVLYVGSLFLGFLSFHEPVTQTHRLTLLFRQFGIKLFRLVLRSLLWPSPSVWKSQWTIELKSHLMTNENYNSRFLREKKELSALWVNKDCTTKYKDIFHWYSMFLFF